MKKIATLLTVFAVTAIAATALAAGKVPLPKGYAKWEKSKQQIITDKNSLFYGIHYTYVDKKAMPVFKAGGKYPEGSQFVIEYFAIKDVGGKPTAGKKNMVVLMRKDKTQKETGGWLFAGFNPDGKPSGVDPVKNCYECHLKMAKDTDLVISKYAEFK
ncbi:cytochrome P460 family protein [Geobacter sp. AOG1]|uniref:cytochrome P460 family protein n=1 Tax=Geobacter sp. AOG1 TaxID=1566346 RepID=UPI001CC7036D|nr:cytochrome P460 family protein [Geobacter sp. AOG1]GFE59390.1 cytochrome c [Geobacter sp. AOG1]